MPPFLPLHGCRPRSAYAGLIKSVVASSASSNLDFMITNLKKGALYGRKSVAQCAQQTAFTDARLNP